MGDDIDKTSTTGWLQAMFDMNSSRHWAFCVLSACHEVGVLGDEKDDPYTLRVRREPAGTEELRHIVVRAREIHEMLFGNVWPVVLT